MNRPDKATLRRILRKMHKQNDYEKFVEPASAYNGMLGKLDFDSVEFSSDAPYHPFPITMKCIHCVMREEEIFCWTCYSWWKRFLIKI